MPRLTRIIGDAAANLLFHWAEVTDVVEHGPSLRSIRLKGSELQGISWDPGDKVQIRLDGLSTRTYTPTSWDAKAGTTSLLAFNHGGDGPGDAWVRNARTGARSQLFGPRTSLRLEDFETPPVFVGDETSFALSLAWRSLHSSRPPAAEVFEVTNADEARAALAARGIESAVLIERKPDSGHLPELCAAVVDAARGAHALCLTGKVQTIAAVRERLKSEGISPTQSKAKAYWDERRAGLD